MLNGKEVAQSICDWIRNYSGILRDAGNTEIADAFAGFSSVLQEMIDDGAYGK